MSIRNHCGASYSVSGGYRSLVMGIMVSLFACSCSFSHGERPKSFAYDVNDSSSSAAVQKQKTEGQQLTETFAIVEKEAVSDNVSPDSARVTGIEQCADVECVAQLLRNAEQQGILNRLSGNIIINTLHDVNLDVLEAVRLNHIKKLTINYAPLYEPALLDENRKDDVSSFNDPLRSPFSRICAVTSEFGFDIEFGPKVNSAAGLFAGCKITGMAKLDTRNITDMSYMFAGAVIDTGLPVFRTNNVTTMKGMFRNSIINRELPKLNTSLVTDVSEMFRSSRINAPLFSFSIAGKKYQDIFSEAEFNNSDYVIDTDGVTDFTEMFRDTVINTMPQIDTSDATNMNSMFIRSDINTDIPTLDTGKVVNMRSMFKRTYIDGNISFTDTSAVTDMEDMFESSGVNVRLPEMDTRSVINMKEMFRNSRLKYGVPEYDTSSVEDMSSMFESSNIKEIPAFNTANVKNMHKMFAETRSLQRLPVLNVENVINMDYFVSGSNVVSIADFKRNDYSAEADPCDKTKLILFRANRLDNETKRVWNKELKCLREYRSTRNSNVSGATGALLDNTVSVVMCVIGLPVCAIMMSGYSISVGDFSTAK